MEFAFVLPVLLLILFATIEYGWYLSWQFVLNNAVSAGARAGVKAKEWGNAPEEPEDLAKAAVKKSFWIVGEDDMDAFAETIIINEVEKAGQPRSLEVMVADYEYKPITGFLPKQFVPQFLGAKAVMAFP